MISGLLPNQDPDLRNSTITPEYLDLMRQRSRQWTVAGLREQLKYFKYTIPDYPEVLEILEGELFARELNSVVQSVKKLPVDRLRLLAEKYRDQEEILEIIQARIAICQGARHLAEKPDAAPAYVV
ncbi:MAG: hypothetical protein HS115_09500 [Spirochaetales bacterium]|nr:hypothetical protein [Spirochaetales bacterium]